MNIFQKTIKKTFHSAPPRKMEMLSPGFRCCPRVKEMVTSVVRFGRGGSRFRVTAVIGQSPRTGVVSLITAVVVAVIFEVTWAPNFEVDLALFALHKLQLVIEMEP